MVLSVARFSIFLLLGLLPAGFGEEEGIGTFAVVYFGRFGGVSRARESTFGVDARTTMRGWKSVMEHVILPNERSQNGTSVDVFAHHWNCSMAPFLRDTFRHRLKASACDDEAHGPYYEFKTWGGPTCEDVNAVSQAMGVPIKPKLGTPEVPQYCLWKSIQRAMKLVAVAEEAGGGATYNGVVLLRHDLVVTSDTLFSVALKGVVPERAVVIPRQCVASGLKIHRKGCGTLKLKRAGADFAHEMDWVFFAKKSSVLLSLAQLTDEWPKGADGSHKAWPTRALTLGFRIYYWKLWNVDFLLGRTWACKLHLRTAESSDVVIDARPDKHACPPRFLQNRRGSLCPVHPAEFASSCIRDPSNFAVVGGK
jgi:hypothetical protein